MHLTSQQEGQLIKKYTGLIWSFINKFLKKSGNALISREECFQECAIVLLNRIREADSLEELDVDFPFGQMRYVMQMHILNSLSMRYQRKTRGIGETAREDFKKTPYRYEENNIPECEITRTTPDRMDEVPFHIDFERFLANLSDSDRKIVQWKLSGVKNMEIARRLGVSNAKVTRILHRIRKIFDAETGTET